MQGRSRLRFRFCLLSTVSCILSRPKIQPAAGSTAATRDTFHSIQQNAKRTDEIIEPLDRAWESNGRTIGDGRDQRAAPADTQPVEKTLPRLDVESDPLPDIGPLPSPPYDSLDHLSRQLLDLLIVLDPRP